MGDLEWIKASLDRIESQQQVGFERLHGRLDKCVTKDECERQHAAHPAPESKGMLGDWRFWVAVGICIGVALGAEKGLKLLGI